MQFVKLVNKRIQLLFEFSIIIQKYFFQIFLFSFLFKFQVLFFIQKINIVFFYKIRGK